MSSYTTNAKNKRTSEVEKIFCLDDYFGRHKYGYLTPTGKALTEEQFRKDYEELNDQR